MADIQQGGEDPTSPLPEIQRPRRSPRRAASILVWLRREGPDRTWEEETETRMLSRYGAGLRCRHSIEVGATLAIVRRDNGQRANVRVIYCRYNAEGCREIGIEFLNCENFWGVDWNFAELAVPKPESLRKPSGPAQDELVPGDQPPRKRDRSRGRANRLADILAANEKQLWDAIKARNTNLLESLVAPDFFRVSREGVQTRSTGLQQLLDISQTDCSLDDFKVTKLNKAAAIVTSKAVPPNSSNEQRIASNATHHTSIWVNRGGKWQVVFQQETSATQDVEGYGHPDPRAEEHNREV